MCSGSSLSSVSPIALLVLIYIHIAWLLITFTVSFPGDLMGPFNTVLRLARDGRDGTERHLCPGSMHVQLTFDAGCHHRIDDASLSFKPYKYC